MPPVAHSVSHRQCVFCGGRPGSKEHVWPQWLKQVLPPVPGSRHTEHVHSRGDEIWRAHAGDAAAKVSKYVCHDCNTGWMAQLAATNQSIGPRLGVLTGESEMDTFARSWLDKRYDMGPPTWRGRLSRPRTHNNLTAKPSGTEGPV